MNELIHKIKTVFNAVITKLSEALSTAQGWILGLFIIIVNFFAGYNLVFWGILFAVGFDAFFGIWVAIKQDRFILSELLRATFFKIAVYLNIIVVFVFIDKFVGTGVAETQITTMLIASAICLAETWSSCGNALIIYPNCPFLRLFRKALTGEIARKLSIKPEEVEEYFNNKNNE